MFKIRKLVIILIFFSTVSSLFAGTPANDSLLNRIKNLHFNSDFEKRNFNDFGFQKFDPVAFLLSVSAIQDTGTIQKTRLELNKYLNKLEAKVKIEKDQAKTMRNIYKQVHADLLRKYDINSKFESIFSDGTYNCVTASALYALILQKFNINYQIKELPTHVYLIADTSNNKIVIETTDPTAGYFNPNDKFKKSYIDYLVQSKIITDAELAAQGYTSLFNKHYYADESINIQELSGLQYYNSGINYVNSQEQKSAYNEFAKAYILYPSDRIKFALLQSAISVLAGKDYSNREDVDLLLDVYSYIDMEKFNEVYLNDFKLLTQRYLIEKNDTVYYNEIYTKMHRLASQKTGAQLSEIYYFQKGRAAYLSKDFHKAINNFARAYKYNPNNLELKSLLASSIIDHINKFNPKKSKKLFDEYFENFPQIQADTDLIKYYCFLNLYLANEAFGLNNAKEGLYYLTTFEKWMKSDKFDLDEDVIGRAYGEACAYYVRKDNTALAKKYLNKGFQYAPDSPELHRKKKYLK